MAEADISFVHLGITIENLKNQISVFGFSIAYYGIIIGIGMLTGIWVAQNDAKRRGQDPDIYLDFALYGIIFAIIGARLYYVIFEWDMYKDNLLQIFNPRTPLSAMEKKDTFLLRVNTIKVRTAPITPP